MKGACDVLEDFGVEYEKKVYSTHRTPAEFSAYVTSAESRGIGVIIAGAGGAAHLAGVAAGQTTLPVIGVPIRSKALGGLDSLLSMVQMPSGIPVSTVAIDGAKNAALIAISIFALTDPELAEKLKAFRRKQAEKVLSAVL